MARCFHCDTFETTDTSATVQFAVTNIADDLGSDDVTVAAVPTGVPQPATILLVATAVIGLGIKRLPSLTNDRSDINIHTFFR
jgi:hypothetical protein